MRHRHGGGPVRYRTRRNRVMYRKRPMHPITMKRREGRRGVRRMAWDIEGAKEELHRIEYMSPEEYIERTGLSQEDLERQEFQYFYDKEKGEERPINELGEYISNPEKRVKIPFVGDDTPGGAEHEGRHRAYAALLKGQKEIPVAVPLTEEDRKGLGEEFIQRAFPEERASYKNQWINRFLGGFPEEYMDKERKEIYREILKEREIKEPQ